jgi:basic amino acid/polyamine antiporter, APA family
VSDGRADEPLKRDIGFFGSAFLAFNGLVGAGIFVLPGTLHDRFGALSVWLFPIFGLLALAIAWPFSRTAGHFGGSGGPIAYARSFGRFPSFLTGWVYYVARAAASAANLTVLATYAAALSPGLAGPVARAALIVGVLAVIVAVNIAGVRRAIRLVDLLTLLKAVPLVVFAVAGLVLFGLPALPAATPAQPELEAAALLILYAFVGFENSTVAAGETANPRRTVPRAMLATILGTAILYTLVQLAYAAAMRPGEGGDAPMVAFGGALFGPAGALILSLTALASLLGNVSGMITSTARVTYALSRDGLLPGWFGKVEPRFATPVPSILFLGALVAALAISGSFVWLAVVSTLARMFVYAIGIAALPKLERRAWLWAPVAVGITLCAWAAAQSSAEAWRTLAILAGSGVVLFLIQRRRAA